AQRQLEPGYGWKICAETASGELRNEQCKTVPRRGRHRLHAIDNLAPTEFTEPSLVIRYSVQPTLHHNSHNWWTVLRAGSNRLTATGPVDCRNGTSRRRNMVQIRDEASGLFRREPGQPA